MEKILSLFANVLKMKPEDVKAKAETPEGLKEIEDVAKGLNVFTPEALTVRDGKLKSDYVDELVKAVGDNKVPNTLYNAIKGNVMDILDKDLAAKLDIPTYSDHNDLIGKVQIKKADGKIDERLQADLLEAKTKVEELNGKLTEKDGEFSKFKESQIVSRLKDDILNKYPYAGKSDEEKKLQRDTLSAFVDTRFKLGVVEDKPALIGEDGKPVKDNSLNLVDPIAHIFEQMKTFVPQDNGATGGNGGGTPQIHLGGTQTTAEFEKEMIEKGATAEELATEYQSRVNSKLIKD